MKYSRLAGKTLRELPQEITSPSYALLVRAGYVKSLGSGLHSLLPLGVRVMQNLTGLIKEVMNSLEGQEVLLPLVSPVDIWNQSGRNDLMSMDMIRFHDRTGRELVLSPTHEEAMVELIRGYLTSYRDLPIFLYQVQGKFRDEKRVKGGLLRAKEFMMKDAYSFHRSFSDLNNFFPKVFAAYKKIFQACHISTIEAESGVGVMGGNKAYEFLVESNEGESIIITCPNCGYRADQDVATSDKDQQVRNLAALMKIKTGNFTTMKTLSKYLGLSKEHLAKPMIYTSKMGLVMAVVRGDYDVSPEKLSSYLGYPVHQLASTKELRLEGLLPGYVSPIELDSDMPIIVDELVASSSNLVYGANEEGCHYINGNFGRDYESLYVADIARAKEGDFCRTCGTPLTAIKAVEVGNIFKLGLYYSRSMDLHYQNEVGNKDYPFMGSYGIGLGRLMSMVVQENHDSKGLRWPLDLAPFKVYLMSVGTSFRVNKITQMLHELLGDYCLYDDREESVGVKFKDSELIGIPLRIVVSSRNLKDHKVEFKDRITGKVWLVDVYAVRDEVLKYLEHE